MSFFLFAIAVSFSVFVTDGYDGGQRKNGEKTDRDVVVSFVFGQPSTAASNSELLAKYKGEKKIAKTKTKIINIHFMYLHHCADI